MAQSLMVSISGVRGIAGESLTPSVVVSYVTAFGMLQRGKKIVLGRDSRVTGEWVQSIARGVLLALGYHVVEIGIVPTPTVQLMVEKLKADGGLIITSSHNPEPWNGLKFVDRDGCFLLPEKCEEMFKMAAHQSSFRYPDFNAGGKVEIFDRAGQAHIDAILSLPYINVPQIKSRHFKVVLDAVNGAGGPVMESLLKQLGCDVVGMNLEQTGRFAHPPEPVPENLGDLCQRVKQESAHLGIAVDPDVDRCVLIDETGKPLGEEYTLALAIEFILGCCGKRGPICKNLSSSRACDDVAERYGCSVYATPVGEIHVAKKMQEVKAVIGGEGNGGVMLPDVHIGRDALVAAVLTLQHLAIHSGDEGARPISSLKAKLPQYEIVKLKAPVEGIDADAAIHYLKRKWEGVEGVISMNEEDGLRIDMKDEQGGRQWVHLRKSNTEPIIRVIGEAATAQQATALCLEFMQQIKSFKLT